MIKVLIVRNIKMDIINAGMTERSGIKRLS